MRKNWDEYFMDIAETVSTRSTCDRKYVGVVFVGEDNQILATGYNGSASGDIHCDEEQHMMENNHCVRTVHAEMNAIIQAAKGGRSLCGSTVYTTTYPCWECFKCLVNVGVTEVIYRDVYRKNDEVEILADRLVGIDIYSLEYSMNFE